MAKGTGSEVKFANTRVYVDNEFVSKVTSFKRTSSIAEENVTGAEDYISGTDVLQEQYVPISVGEMAEVEGISQETANGGPDDGQYEMSELARAGTMCTIRRLKNTGYGENLTGFFTNFEETGSTSEVYKWKASFRVNSITQVVPGS